jgi:hypothetical protein
MMAAISRRPRLASWRNAACIRYLLTASRKTLRPVASQLQLACLQLRYRVAELYEFMTGAFGAVRTTPQAVYAHPIHLPGCSLAHSLNKSLIA